MKSPIFGLLACAFLVNGLVNGTAQAQGAPDAAWVTNTYAPFVFSPDGTVLACNPYRTINFLSSTNGHVLGTWGLEEGEWSVARLAYSPDGQFLAAGPDEFGDYRIRIRSIHNGQVIQRLDGYSNTVYSLAFRPDGSLLAAAGRWGTMVWRLSDGALLTELPTGLSYAVCFSPDGSLLAAGTVDGKIRIWKVSDWEVLRVLPSAMPTRYVFALAFSPDGKTLASGTSGYWGWMPDFGGTVPALLNLWRLADGHLLRSFTNYSAGPAFPAFPNSINSLAFSPDGGTLLTGSADRTIRFWRVSDGALLRLYDQPAENDSDESVHTVAYSPDGRRYAYYRVSDVVLANPPLVIQQAIYTNGQAILRWEGGRGAYQVQQRTNLKSGFWQCAGFASTNMSITNPIPPGPNPVFYRVLSTDP